jgi:uncharacterized membrane protein YeaQ/YmgE (transglycosylase-associated protein family)
MPQELEGLLFLLLSTESTLCIPTGELPIKCDNMNHADLSAVWISLHTPLSSPALGAPADRPAPAPLPLRKLPAALLVFRALLEEGINSSARMDEGGTMIGMSFWAFLVLLVAGLIAAVVVHYIFRYRFLEGFDSFLGQWIAGWIGAWLGSPVLGHWFEGVKIADIYLIPALLGAFAGAFALTASFKASAKVFAAKSELKAV